MSAKNIVLLGDLGLDHQGFPPTPVIAGSPTVLVDGKPVARVGDPLAPHSKPKHPPHPRAIAAGSSTVLIDGMPAAVTGGAVSCGGVTIGSGSVVIGDTHTPAPFSGISAATRSPASVVDACESPAASAYGPQAKQPLLPGIPRDPVNGQRGHTDAGTISSANAPSDSSELATRTLRIGVFFDGTGNHMENDLRSTDRDITNVAKLYRLYPASATGEEYARVYIEGPGTVDGEETDSGFEAKETVIGMALGLGDEGGHARIQEALANVRLLLESQAITEVVFDVFGFSRGAALARHFVNLIHAWPEIWPPVAKANIEFVGLFDTVGSFYVPGNSENFDFNLHLHPQSANHVVHLTAFHEIRKNFPLTSIRSAEGLSVNFIEKAMPGVHSDVGGGYENPEVDFRNYETFFIRAYQGHGLNSETIRAAQEKISELNRADPRNIQPRVQGTDVFAEERRATRKELAIYALHQMHRYAQESGVPLAPMRESQPEFLIPNELQKKLDKWLAAGGKLTEARDYLEGYIHTSHREWTLAHYPEPSHQRRVFLIKPEKAVKAEVVHA